jgi:aminoglycoside 6-adenylyltransferase
MSRTEVAARQFEERLAAWAKTRPDIRAAIVVGSRARADHPADEWSDLDIVIIARDPERCLARTDWLQDIGNPWLTFLEPTATGGEMERRVLFEGGFDVDFAVIPNSKVKRAARFLPALKRLPILFRLLPKRVAQQMMQDVAAAAHVFARGARVIVDKDGLAGKLPLILSGSQPYRPPPQPEFLEVVNDFWYHTVWTAKKLRRRELWVAKSCCDTYMKRLLLRMIEWHARATKGWDHDTWEGGRFLEEWADPRALEGLRDAFAHYDEDDMCRALFATMDLFRWLAIETAGRLGYLYPTVADQCVTEWITTCLSERTASESSGGG